MLKGNINQPLPADAPQWLPRALEFLRECNWHSCQPGRYPIRGDELYVNLAEVDTLPAEQRFPEAHDLYADVHLVIEGEERIGITLRADQPLEKDLRGQEDAVLYAKDLPDAQQIILHEGEYLVCMPQDIHRPGCAVQQSKRIRKVIVKAKVV